MKYIKTFEESNNEDLQVGDYVICDESETGASDEIIEFLKVNIGKFIRYKEGTDNNGIPKEYNYLVKYEYVPSELIENEFDHGEENSRLMKRNEIVYWSKYKEDVLLKLQENKFNI